MIWSFTAPTGAPRFEAAFIHRLRVAVAATILRAWHREGFAFVTLALVGFGRSAVVRGVAMTPGTLVLRPVKACAERGCSGPRLEPLTSLGLFCEQHEREAFARAGRTVGLVYERATWPIDSDEARELAAMTLALGARYAEAADPFEPGVDFEARVRELRAQLEGVEAARAEVV